MGVHTFMFLLLNSLIYFSNGNRHVVDELKRVRDGIRHSALLHEMSADGSLAQEVAKKAVEEFNKQSSSEKSFKLIELKSVEMETADSVTFTIEAVIGKTKCPKSEEHDIESCALAKKDRDWNCRFQLSLNPLSDKYELMQNSCRT